MPGWLELIATVSLAIAGTCAMVVAADIVRGHRQSMWIMDIVWPVTALYTGPLGLYAYYRIGRLSTREAVRAAKRQGEQPPGRRKPFYQKVAVGATHCGAGCTLGDLIAEWLVFFAPLTLFGRRIFGTWLVDYAAAFTLGIAFQYFTIKPMKRLSAGAGLVQALKADSLSLTSWQVGMYGWMAIVSFAIFGHEIEKTSPVFWFLMQIAMLCGLATAFPVNWWLLRKGIKEPM